MTTQYEVDAERAPSQDDALRTLLASAAVIVGPDRVDAVPTTPDEELADLGPNTSMFRGRGVRGVIRPRTTAEVQRIVKLYGKSEVSGGLHAFSSGRNWGLGSREPAFDNSAVLDLGGLDQLRDLHVSGGWAVIEPGVSQGQLAEALKSTNRMINVTVSSAHTSVIGNALDRGVGLRQQRVDDLLGLEVVLPDGDVMRVGWWPSSRHSTPVYPHGLGPSLLPLFLQSNLGVVTAATVRLLPRPEALRVVRLNFTPSNLGAATRLLRRFTAQGLAHGVTKVYNPPAARPYGGNDGEFLAHVCVDGTQAAVEALTQVVVDEAKAADIFTEISATDTTDPDSDKRELADLVERSYAGDPDVSDKLFEAKMGHSADQIDDRAGFLFFLPMVPFTAEAITRVETLLDGVYADTNVRCGATLNVLNADLVDCVVTMKFSRDEAESQRAHRALDLLYERFAEAGFVPYRLDVDHADWVDRFSSDPQSRAFIRRLKGFVDPQQTIAPGRYR